MAKQKIETIPFSAKVKLEIPGSFYARLQQLTLHYSQTRPPEELVAALQKLKSGSKDNAENEFEYHIQTLTILMFEIETAAKNQGVTSLEEVEIPDPVKPNEN